MLHAEQGVPAVMLNGSARYQDQRREVRRRLREARATGCLERIAEEPPGKMP